MQVHVVLRVVTAQPAARKSSSAAGHSAVPMPSSAGAVPVISNGYVGAYDNAPSKATTDNTTAAVATQVEKTKVDEGTAGLGDYMPTYGVYSAENDVVITAMRDRVPAMARVSVDNNVNTIIRLLYTYKYLMCSIMQRDKSSYTMTLRDNGASKMDKLSIAVCGVVMADVARVVRLQARSHQPFPNANNLLSKTWIWSRIGK